MQVELDLMSHWVLMENLRQGVNEGLWLSGYRSGRLQGCRFKSLKRWFMNYYSWHKRDLNSNLGKCPFSTNIKYIALDNKVFDERQKLNVWCLPMQNSHYDARMILCGYYCLLRESNTYSRCIHKQISMTEPSQLFLPEKLRQQFQTRRQSGTWQTHRHVLKMDTLCPAPYDTQ